MDLFSLLPPGHIDNIISSRIFHNYDTLSELNGETILSIVSHIRCGWTKQEHLRCGKIIGAGLAQYGALGDGNSNKHNYDHLHEVHIWKGDGEGRIIDITVCSNCSVFLTACGDVYMCGSTLSLFGTDEDWLRPRKIDMSFLKTSDKVVSVVGGSLHLCLITAKGYVYTMGMGDSGQLGDGISKTFHKLTVPILIDPQKMLIKINNTIYCDRVVQVFARKKATLLLTIYGQVYICGTLSKKKFKDLVQVPTASLDSRVCFVALTERIVYLLTKSGNLYNISFIKGNKTLSSMKPTLIKYEEPIKSIAVGKEHLLALGFSGLVYTNGNGRYGRLGDGNEENHFIESPSSQSSSSTKSIIQKNTIGHVVVNPNYFLDADGKKDPAVHVYAYATHSLIITKSGALYGFGRSNYGVFADGISKMHNLKEPTRIGEGSLSNEYVMKVVSDEKHILILTW